MNVRKLRKLQKWILAEPRRFDMQEWSFSEMSEVFRRQNPPCGTVGCLAGMACHMDGMKLDGVEAFGAGYSPRWIPDAAEEILGLDCLTASRLFYIQAFHPGSDAYWPEKFEKQYLAAKTPAGKARVAVRRIDHFIKTKGAE